MKILFSPSETKKQVEIEKDLIKIVLYFQNYLKKNGNCKSI